MWSDNDNGEVIVGELPTKQPIDFVVECLLENASSGY